MPKKLLSPFFNAYPPKSPIILDSFSRQKSGDGESLEEQKSTTKSEVNTGIQQSPVPVFLTPQSLITFPGASLAVNLIWNFAAVVYPPCATWILVPIIAALLVGFFIYLQSETENMSSKQKSAAIFIAFLNSIWLALVVLGIDIVSPPNN